MKISILKSCAGLTFSFIEGQDVDINEEIAKDLISAGYAKADKASKQHRWGNPPVPLLPERAFRAGQGAHRCHPPVPA